MNYNSLKMLSLAAGFAVLGTLTAQAQDKATLNLLVIKGVITQDEADTIAKNAATPVIAVTPKDAAVKGLKLEGMIQTQFDWLSTSDKGTGASNPPALEQAFIRRAYLGAIADMGNGWGGEILFDFAAGAQGAAGGTIGGSGTLAQNNFEKIIITKKFDDLMGTGTAGFQKVNFTLEEITSSSVVKPIERSIVSRYFDESYNGPTSRRIGFANRHNGLFWDGKVGDTGITYGGAVTTGIQNSIAYTATGGLNKLGAWAYVAYGNAWNDANLTYKLGLNYGYSSDGNSISGTSATNASNSIWGYNPYFTMTWNKAFQLDAEFLQASVEHGRTNAAGGLSTASPYGFTITPSYKINDQWEVVARYSYLNTDGRGTNISDVVRNANNVITPATAGGALFNDAQQFYVGVNWYIVGNAVKASLGYEYTEFSNRQTAAAINDANLTGPKADVSGVRARLQLLF